MESCTVLPYCYKLQCFCSLRGVLRAQTFPNVFGLQVPSAEPSDLSGSKPSSPRRGLCVFFTAFCSSYNVFTHTLIFFRRRVGRSGFSDSTVRGMAGMGKALLNLCSALCLSLH